MKGYCICGFCLDNMNKCPICDYGYKNKQAQLNIKSNKDIKTKEAEFKNKINIDEVDINMPIICSVIKCEKEAEFKFPTGCYCTEHGNEIATELEEQEQFNLKIRKEHLEKLHEEKLKEIKYNIKCNYCFNCENDGRYNISNSKYQGNYCTEHLDIITKKIEKELLIKEIKNNIKKLEKLI